jgi:hypothetical protein
MRKYLLGLCAVVLAIGFSAFTKVNVHHPKKGFTSYPFVHIAHSQDNNATDWIYRASQSGCVSSDNYCKAFFDESSQPAESANPSNVSSLTGLTTGDYQGN